MSTSECKKVLTLLTVSTMVLIGLNIKFYEIFAKAACLLIPFFLLNFFLTKSRLSLSSTESLCAEHVNCKLFLAVVSNSECDWLKSFNTRNTHKSGV